LLPLRSPLLTPRVLRDAAPQPPAVGDPFCIEGFTWSPRRSPTWTSASQPPTQDAAAGSPSTAKCLHADGPLRPSFGPVSASSISKAAPRTSPSTSPAPSAGGPPLTLSFPSVDPHRCGWPHRLAPLFPAAPNWVPHLAVSL
jgi:hypothetical protein